MQKTCRQIHMWTSRHVDSGKGTVLNMPLIKLLQKRQKCLDGIVGILLIDLSKAYDCANHDLIIGKLEAYGVGKSSLRLIQNYLSQRQKLARPSVTG